MGGVAARQQMLGKLKNTITSVKHLLGRKFSDQVVQNEQKWMPCKLVQLPNDALGIEVSKLVSTSSGGLFTIYEEEDYCDL